MMFRRVYASSLVFASLLSAGCQLVADFDKDGSTSAGTGAAAQGGANPSLAGNGNKPISGGASSASLAKTTISPGNSGTEPTSMTGYAGGAATTTVAVNGGSTGVATTTILTNSGGTDAGGSSMTSPNGGMNPTTGVAATTTTSAVAQGGNANGGTTSSLVGGSAAVTGGTSSATGGAATEGVATGGIKATGGSSTGGAATSSAVTIPTVVSISPTNGAKGVTQDATIQIVFSEPMAATSVASALSVSGITAADLKLRWADNNQKLTVTPPTGGGGLYYGGLGPVTYTINLTTSATDIDGTHLATPFTSSFQTLQRIQRVLAPEQVASFDSYGAAAFHTPPSICTDPAGVIETGRWTASMVGAGSTYAYLVFNLGSVGATSEVYSFDWATLRATQNAATGNFYSNGYVFVERLAYTALESITTVADGVDTWGTLANSTSGTYVGLDVTTPFSARFRAGDTRILLRVGPGGIYPDNTNANFTCGGFGMELSYLAQ